MPVLTSWTAVWVSVFFFYFFFSFFFFCCSSSEDDEELKSEDEEEGDGDIEGEDEGMWAVFLKPVGKKGNGADGQAERCINKWSPKI